MLLTISTTHSPATDLGFLLHKNPSRPQSFELPFGQAHVYYPRADAEQCTVALLLDIDPVSLVRRERGEALAEYVNDRPYVASSFLSVAIAHVFGSALNGRSRERADLVELPIPLEAVIAALPGDDALIRELFEPLGYEIEIERPLLDPVFPAWGNAAVCTLRLRAVRKLQELLSHLYVLIPVLDNEKHYYVDSHEIEKLLRHGENWLSEHPQRTLIAHRYLRQQRSLASVAIAQMSEPEAAVEIENTIPPAIAEAARPNLHQHRLAVVIETLKAAGARRIADLGCGEGKLLRLLATDPHFTEIIGMDVSHRLLAAAAERLERLPKNQFDKVRLIQGALTYKDSRLAGFDAAVLVEVIEHLDMPRLAALERAVFDVARPGVVIVTTPNAEYNVRWQTLPAGEMRHTDHRFEWTRREFEAWGENVASRFGYTAQFAPIGESDAEVGAPSQMSIFTRKEEI